MQIPSEEIRKAKKGEEIKKAKKGEEIRKAKKGEESEERASLLRRDESSWKHNGGVAQFQLVNAYNCNKRADIIAGPQDEHRARKAEEHWRPIKDLPQNELPEIEQRGKLGSLDELRDPRKQHAFKNEMLQQHLIKIENV